VILGGIAFDTRPEGTGEGPSPRDSEFDLYADKEAALSTPYGPQVAYLVHFGGSVRGVGVGTPVELLGIRVGQVTDVRLEGEAGPPQGPGALTPDPERGLLPQRGLANDGQKAQTSTDAAMGRRLAR